MAKASPVVELNDQQTAALQHWELLKAEIARLQSIEIAQRLELIKGMPFNADKESGGQSIKLGAGWKLSLDKPVNYTTDKDQNIVVAGLQALGTTNPVAAAELIRWEAVVSVSTYKKLTDEEKRIVASFIGMKPGTPALALVPPPEPKS